MLMRLVRMFGAFASGNYAWYRMWEYGGASDSVQDLEQTLAEMALEKLAMTDPRLSGVGIYVGQWAKSTVDRFCYDLESAVKPEYVHNQVHMMQRRFLEKGVEENVKPNKDGKSNPKRPTVAELIERGLIRAGRGSSVSTNEPAYPHSSEESSVELGETLPELFVDPEVDGGEKERIELDAQTIGILNKALDCLPPRDAYVLKQRIFAKRTLRDIGEELGVTREGVRVLQNEIITRLGTMRSPKGTTAIIVVDKALLRQWCEHEIKSDALRRYFYFNLGVGGAGRDLQMAMASEPGCTGSSLRKDMTKLKERLIKLTARLPEEKRFVLAMSKVEMYRRARAALRQLEKITGRPRSEMMGSIREMLEMPAESCKRKKPQAAEAGVTVVEEATAANHGVAVADAAEADIVA